MVYFDHLSFVFSHYYSTMQCAAYVFKAMKKNCTLDQLHAVAQANNLSGIFYDKAQDGVNSAMCTGMKNPRVHGSIAVP